MVVRQTRKEQMQRVLKTVAFPLVEGEYDSDCGVRSTAAPSRSPEELAATTSRTASLFRLRSAHGRLEADANDLDHFLFCFLSPRVCRVRVDAQRVEFR